MAITPVPSMTPVPHFPALSERAAGTYNASAYNFGTHLSVTFNGENFDIGMTGDIEFRFLKNLSVLTGPQTIIVNGTSGGNGSYSGTLSFSSAVPEPATWAMMIIGFTGAGVAIRRRRRDDSVAFA